MSAPQKSLAPQWLHHLSEAVFHSDEPSAEKVCRGASTGKRHPTGVHQGTAAKSLPEGRWLLGVLVELTDWARLEFKPAESRSLVLKRGLVQDWFYFKIGEGIIPTVQESREELGEVVHGQTQCQAECERDAHSSWNLDVIYKVPVSTVEGLERIWLGVPRSFCSIGLYCTGSEVLLPGTSVVEEKRQQKHSSPWSCEGVVAEPNW